MINLFKGWLKIYLFYGAIFFLLGLFGYLASDQIKLANWSARQIQKINKVWSLITFRDDKDQTVPASTNQSGKIVLQVYQTEDMDSRYKELLQQLQSELQRRFRQVIIMPVVDLNTQDLELVNPNTSLILIGYKQAPNLQRGGLAMRNSLYFGMPEPAVHLFAGKLIQTMTGKLPAFHFTKQVYGYSAIYELNWDTSGDTENFDNEIFSTFMKVMDQEVIQALSKQTLK